MKKLLIVDDSITIQKVVELVLSEEGFEIKSANNGEEALSYIRQDKPDVVIADIEMPLMNGYELCDSIKKDPALRHIPVILLSGTFEPLSEDLARRAGADGNIVKPFESKEFLEKIEMVMSAPSVSSIPQEPDTERIVIGDLLKDEIPSAEIPVAVESFVENPAPVAAEYIPSGIEEKAVAEMAAPETTHKDISGMSGAMSQKEELISAIRAEMLKTLPDRDAIRAEVTKNLGNINVIVENVLRDMFSDSMKDIIERIAWEIIPGIAEALIAREIEKIRAEK